MSSPVEVHRRQGTTNPAGDHGGTKIVKLPKSLQESFDEFDALNPGVYDLFKHFAFEKIRKGAKKLGAKAVIERIRWEESCPTIGDEFKINNNFPAYYARKFMKEFPIYGGIFETRKVKGDREEVPAEENGQQILI